MIFRSGKNVANRDYGDSNQSDSKISQRNVRSLAATACQYCTSPYVNHRSIAAPSPDPSSYSNPWKITTAMSEPDALPAPHPHPHPSHGGKSIESVQAQQNALRAGERQPYKSWRKKYRKSRVHFDGVLDENRRLFREEQKLQGLAKRLREELE